jgi:hypothetical protein
MLAIRPLIFPRLLLAVAAAIALLLVPARLGYGQDTPPRGTLIRGSGEWISNASPAAAPAVFATTQITGTQHVYLPLIFRSPGVGIQFGSLVDAQNNLLDPGTTFTYGITHLYYRYTVESAAGRAYRAEWSLDGVRQPQLDDSGTIPSASATFASYICSLTLGPCDGPLPRGAYKVQFFIDGALHQEATATIQ